MLHAASSQAAERPNILVIWGDDIGITNISHYSRGMTSYPTPNINRIAEEGLQPEDPTLAELLRPLGFAPLWGEKPAAGAFPVHPFATYYQFFCPCCHIFFIYLV